MTPPEASLWIRLRIRGDDLPRFRRQHPCGPYVLDFYCPKASLAVEVDGLTHDTDGGAARDQVRDAWLLTHSIEMLRIPAREVFRDADAVADMVRETARGRIVFPPPR